MATRQFKDDDCANRGLLAFASVAFLIVLSACNGPDGGNNLGLDWVGDPSQPGPTPTASPTSTPTPPPYGELYIGPPELEKYVAKFVDDGFLQGVDVTPDMKGPMLEVRNASLDGYGGSVIGLCETASNLRRVTFDPDFWNSVSETQREILAHHEFGHCVLYRPHRSTTLSTGGYASIMYPVIMSSAAYTGSYDYYQEELFTWNALNQAQRDPNTAVTHICDLEDVMH